MTEVLKRYVVDYAKSNRFANNDYRTQKADSFRWYDMGVGLRALTLGGVLRHFACEYELDEMEESALHKFAIDHVNYLLDAEFHSGHNNHGAFQSAGSLGLCAYYTVLPNCDSLSKISEVRLRAYFDRAIIGGVHSEHSTAYMIHMLDLLAALAGLSGLSSNLENYLDGKLSDLSNQLQWFIAPNGLEVPIGDTDEKMMPVSSLLKAPQTAVENSLWLASRGALGARPEETIWHSEKSGYAASRHIDLGEYILFSAAFHSRTHKHADDGNVLWYSNHKPILIDSGKYGYFKKSEHGSALRDAGFWYADPKRVYVEGNSAHNVVEIDGRATNRRVAKAYGGAVTAAAKDSAGAALFEMELDREESVSQKRTVVHQAGEFIIVIDRLSSFLGERSYKQWFQISPRFDQINALASYLDFFSKDAERLRVSDHSSSAKFEYFHGQTEPFIQGWHSREPASFYPNFSVSLESSGAVTTFITLLEYFGSESETLTAPSVTNEILADGQGRLNIVTSTGRRLEYEVRTEAGEYVIRSREYR